MKDPNVLGMVVFGVLLGPRMCYVLCMDLAHPEIWDQDWTHDPRIYLPGTVIVFSLVFIWSRWYRRRCKRRMDEKIKDIYRRLDEDPACIDSLIDELHEIVKTGVIK